MKQAKEVALVKLGLHLTERPYMSPSTGFFVEDQTKA